MSRYLWLETRLAVRCWPWVALMLSTVLRIAGAVGPSSGWISFLSVAHPLVVAASALHLLDQERRWRTKLVLVAAPRSTHEIFAFRFLLLATPLFALPFSILPPVLAMSIVARAALLASVVLTAGIPLGIELGAGLGLAWWSLSFIASIAVAPESDSVLSWFSVIAIPEVPHDVQTLAGTLGRLGLATALLAWPIVGRFIRSVRD